MTDTQDELTGLLSSFHDFDIVEARWTDNVLSLGLEIPWGSMWVKDDYSYRIQIELSGCSEFLCRYWVIKSKDLIRVGDNKVMQDTEERTTTIPADILPLDISIQSSTFIQPNKYELHCIGGPDIDFATLTVTAGNYKIFDKRGDKVVIETFRQWHQDWWNGIQKMWDEQKQNKDTR